MRRRIITSCAVVVALVLVMPGRGPSIEDVFVATTEAAAESEGAVCLMPEAYVVSTQQGAIAIPKMSRGAEGDSD